MNKRKIKSTLHRGIIVNSGRYFPIVILFALPTIVILRLLRRFVIVRFGEIPSRLGHMSADLDTYLSLKQIPNCVEKRTFDIFCKPKSNISFNRFLLEKVEDYFFLMPRYIVLPFLILCNSISAFKEHRVYLTPEGNYEGELNYIIHNLPSPILIKNAEIKSLIASLTELSLPTDRIVSLALRDDKYVKEATGTSAEYSKYRNFDNSQSIVLISELIKFGYGVVRGGNLAHRLKSPKAKGFFDYADSTIGSDRNDLALFSIAKFCVGMDTGLHNLALMFRKPLYLISTPSFTNKLTSPLLKLVHYCDFLDVKTGAPINLREMNARGVFKALGAEHFKALEIRPSRMAEEDIVAFVKELNLFEEGLWQESEESREIKRVFLKYLQPHGFRPDSAFKFPNFWAKKSIWLD